MAKREDKRRWINQAECALETYAKLSDASIEADRMDTVTDLMTNLLHYAKRHRLDTVAIMQRVEMHFEAEA